MGMRAKVIRINFKSSTAATPGRQSYWTREELRAWACINEKHTQKSNISIVLLASLLHVALYFGLKHLPPTNIFEQGNKGSTTRVTLIDGNDRGTREKGLPEPQAFPNKPADAPVISGPSTSQKRAARAAEVQPFEPPAATTETLPSPADVPHYGALEQPRNVKVPKAKKEQITENTITEENSQQVQTEPKETTATTGIGFSRKLQDLLPNSQSEFVASQRRIGSTYGKGAVGGDLDPESLEPTGYKAPDRGKTSVTRYDYASYFMSLDRRFTEAWGGTRVLPRGSNFQGTVGEFIEYDIVINRNGTLSKIVNVTQKKQKARDFSAVDNLVHEVFSHVFPMNPVPDRIKDDPLILRKRIQFTGYQYFMF